MPVVWGGMWHSIGTNEWEELFLETHSAVKYLYNCSDDSRNARCSTTRYTSVLYRNSRDPYAFATIKFVSSHYSLEFSERLSDKCIHLLENPSMAWKWGQTSTIWPFIPSKTIRNRTNKWKIPPCNTQATRRSHSHYHFPKLDNIFPGTLLWFTD